MNEHDWTSFRRLLCGLLLIPVLTACAAVLGTDLTPAAPLPSTAGYTLAEPLPASTDVPTDSPTLSAAPVSDSTPARTVQAHPIASYPQISWSPDGLLLGSGGNDDKVIVWDASNLEPIYALTHPNMVFSRFTRFSPSGRWLMVSEGRHQDMADGSQAVFFDVSVWDLQTGTRLERLTEMAGVWQVAWHAEGNLLAYLDSSTIRFWAVPGSGILPPEPVAIPEFEVGDLRWLPDGTLIAAGRFEVGICLWRSTQPENITLLESSEDYSTDVQRILLSPDMSLVTAPGDREIKVWDTGTGEVRYSLQSEDLLFPVLAFSPDNALLATATTILDDDVRIWDLASGGVVVTLAGEASSLYQLAFSPDGKTLAGSEEDGALRLWRLESYLHPPVTPMPIPTPTPVPVSKVAPVFLTSLSVPSVNPEEPGSHKRLRWLDRDTLNLITEPFYFEGDSSGQQRITSYWSQRPPGLRRCWFGLRMEPGWRSLAPAGP